MVTDETLNEAHRCVPRDIIVRRRRAKALGYHYEGHLRGLEDYSSQDFSLASDF